MNARLAVGLLDSGIAPPLTDHVLAARRFRLASDGATVESAPTDAPGASHGSALAEIILAKAPGAALFDAQVFASSRPGAPAVAAAGLDWLVGEGVRIVTMSFGLRHDRAVLRKACANALRAGVILLGAAPARGAPVWPAAYDGVIRVTGDARCAAGEVSALDSAQADIGAHPRPLDNHGEDAGIGGASFAVAYAAGLLAARFAEEPDPTREAALAWLRTVACHHGTERRSARG